MTLEQITKQELNRIACLVIGQSGVGKTCLIRTLLGQEFDPKKGWEDKHKVDWNILLLSSEGGLLSISDVVDRINGFKIKNKQDMREVFQLLAHDKDTNEKFKGGWIVVDSLTEISQLIEKQAGIDIPEERQTFKMWKQYKDDMHSIIKSLRDMTQYNILFTCLIKTQKIIQNKTEKIVITPNVTGSLKDDLISFFDEVFYYDYFDDQRGFLTENWQWRKAKDRSGKLNRLEEPNLLKIYNKIIGE